MSRQAFSWAVLGKTARKALSNTFCKATGDKVKNNYFNPNNEFMPVPNFKNLELGKHATPTTFQAANKMLTRPPYQTERTRPRTNGDSISPGYAQRRSTSIHLFINQHVQHHDLDDFFSTPCITREFHCRNMCHGGSVFGFRNEIMRGPPDRFSRTCHF